MILTAWLSLSTSQPKVSGAGWEVLTHAEDSERSNDALLKVYRSSGIAGLRREFVGRRLWCNLWIGSSADPSYEKRNTLRPFDGVRVRSIKGFQVEETLKSGEYGAYFI